MSAERTLWLSLEPFSDALGVEVMLDVAGQGGNLGFRVELDCADDAFVICLEFLSVVNVLGKAAQRISLLRLRWVLSLMA